MSALPYQSIPLVKGLPLVGNLPKFLRSPLDNARSLEVHGNVVRSRTFFETVTLLGPDANQFVLHDREGNFSSRGGWYYWIDAVFPGAIMAMDNPAHKHHRRIMQGAFQRRAMERYVADMGPAGLPCPPPTCRRPDPGRRHLRLGQRGVWREGGVYRRLL